MTDLVSVKQSLYAANKEVIKVDDAVLLRLAGSAQDGIIHTAAVMAYISPSTSKFYLSRGALFQLNVISNDFPKIGGASTIESDAHSCGCPIRMLPPTSPDCLPFPCIPANNTKMQQWLVDRFSASTFNQCTHQQLSEMTGPAIRLHVDPDAVLSAVHSPAPVPLHGQEDVKKQLDDDASLGVLEKVPIGEPSSWCHRMVIAPKANGSPR